MKQQQLQEQQWNKYRKDLEDLKGQYNKKFNELGKLEMEEKSRELSENEKKEKGELKKQTQELKQQYINITQIVKQSQHWMNQVSQIPGYDPEGHALQLGSPTTTTTTTTNNKNKR